MQYTPTVKFTFAPEWGGLGKMAVVRAGDSAVEVLVTNNEITIPVESLAEAGVNLIVGVYGANTSIVIPTVWCPVGEILDGTTIEDADNNAEPTPSDVAQMLAYAESIETTAQTLEENVITETQVVDTNANQYGTVDVDAELVDASETGKKLKLTFENLKGNGITSITYSDSGKYEGRINIKTDADTSGTNYDALIEPIAYFRSVTNRSQAYAIGTTGEGEEEEPVPSDDPAYHNNSKYYAEQASSSATTASSAAGSAMGYASSASSSKTAAQTAQGKAEDAQAAAEAAATSASTDAGIASGSASSAGDSATSASSSADIAAGARDEALASASRAHDDAATASSAATSASSSATNAYNSQVTSATNKFLAEAWAVGTMNGSPVSSSAIQYHNNAKYYAEQTGTDRLAVAADKADADGYKDAAGVSALKAEGFAVGQQNGTDVGDSSPYYENNAKYYAEVAEEYLGYAETFIEDETLFVHKGTVSGTTLYI